MNTKPSSPNPKPKNWLLAKSRQWHLWGGLIAALFLLIFGTTGIVLNYKKPVFTALGLEMKQPETKINESQFSKPKSAHATLTTTTGLAAVGVNLDGALAVARTEWGETTLERIELKEERGEWIYKIKAKGGGELWVNATTGSHFLKGEYERIGKTGADGTPARSTDWGKILIDLHTGKIGGETGKAIMSVAALLLLFLTVSGVYMWLKPLLIRRQNAKAKAGTAASQPAHIPTTPTPSGATVPAAARCLPAHSISTGSPARELIDA
ncbi:MAG: PepSY domain-containing protein [Verrucomicrobia bacterium]|nr:PepSY domain-containing protein [Verrucomicrobiota bacterium]